jgi:hypothetical protein
MAAQHNQRRVIVGVHPYSPLFIIASAVCMLFAVLNSATRANIANVPALTWFYASLLAVLLSLLSF